MPENESVVIALKSKMENVKNLSAMEKASKPCGILWAWCLALLECDDNLITTRHLAVQLQDLIVNTSSFSYISYICPTYVL